MLHVVLPGVLACTSVLAEPIELAFGVSSATVLRGVALGEGGVDVHAAARLAHPSGWGATLGATALHSRLSSRQPHWHAQWFARFGYGHRLDGDWSAQVAYAHYAYDGPALLRRYAHGELGATLAYRDLLYVSLAGLRRLAVAGGGGNASRDSVAGEIVVRHALSAPLWVDAGFGRLQGRGGSTTYDYGHVGFGAQWDETQGRLSYIATGAAARRRYGDAASNRWTASLGWSF